MSRVRKTVSSYWAGDVTKPGAMAVTTAGANRIPRMVISVSRAVRSVKATFASSQASSCVFFFRYSVKIGTKETVSEPSARSRRRRLGMRKATKKASVAMPAPKNPATTMSRMKPKTRESMVAAPTTPAAFATREFSLLGVFSFSMLVR
jgi:hypothetical protein